MSLRTYLQGVRRNYQDWKVEVYRAWDEVKKAWYAR